MKAPLRTAAPVVFAILAGCGGGGGGGGSGGIPTAIEVPFSSFAAIAPGQTVVMEGIAVTAGGSQAIDANDDVSITSANLNSPGTATARLGYDGSRALRALALSTPQSSVSFDRDTAGHSIRCSGSICFAANPTADATAIDAFAARWNYQSFGVWSDEPSPTAWLAGAASVGAATAANALPLSGNALFAGVAAGWYFNESGTPFFTVAGMRASVDFGARTIGFSTAETTLFNTNTGASSTDPNLNLAGTLSYAQGVNSFSGSVSAAPVTGLTGQASGRFYGPAAEEIGGVYSLQGPGVSRMLGGFGGKR